MKFKELIDDVNWNEVKESLEKFYDFDDEGILSHQMVFEKLQNMEPVANNMRIIVDYVEPDGKLVEDGYWYVNGKNGTLQKETEDYEYFKENCTEEFANSEVGFALDFTPWKKWLGMDIDKNSANDIRLMRSDIVAHCLYEMTFIGYDENNIQSRLQGLNDQVKELKNMSKEELKKKTVSFEEFKERLKQMSEDVDDMGKEDD